MSSEYPAITKCFLDAVDMFANPRAQMFRTQHGSAAAVWESISAKEMLRRVAGVARALAGLGIRPGDRVGLFAPNCPEWAIADFAIQGLGAVSVPVYFNESPDRLTYILKDSGARVVFTSGEEQARKIAECRAQLPALEHVISVAPPADLQGEILRYETLIATAGDADIARVSEPRRRSDRQTAGDNYLHVRHHRRAKGRDADHANLTSNALDSAHDIEICPRDVALSFLPLSHVYERTMDYSYFFRGVSVAYVEQIETVSQALLEVHPTMVAAVPRFFEKIYANIIEKGHRETGLKRAIFDWALRVATQAAPWRAYGKNVPWTVKLRWRMANRLVYSKIRCGHGRQNSHL